MKLIDADALIETLAIVAKKMAKSDAQKALMGRVLYILEHRHEDIVRCKDCVKYFRDTPYCAKHNKGYCHLDGLVKSENHYCGYGEREE